MLTSPAHRDCVARGIERMLDSLDRRAPHMRMLPRRAALRANETTLQTIATTLRGSAPVYAPGVALVTSLLSDGMGLAYRGDAAALAGTLEDARAALAGNGPLLELAPARPRGRVLGGTPATRLSETLAMHQRPLTHRRHESA
jgi:hypothetical protein